MEQWRLQSEARLSCGSNGLCRFATNGVMKDSDSSEWTSAMGGSIFELRATKTNLLPTNDLKLIRAERLGLRWCLSLFDSIPAFVYI
jgi:hypothetical protein